VDDLAAASILQAHIDEHRGQPERGA